MAGIPSIDKLAETLNRMIKSDAKPANILNALRASIQIIEREVRTHSIPEPYTAKELIEKVIPPPKWIVPELINEGLTILAGDAKIGKSFLCWNLAIAAATGGNALSQFDLFRPFNTLYCALEDPEPLLQDRINSILHGTQPPSNLYILNSFDRLNAEGLAKLKTLIDDYDLEFIIIDTLQHVQAKPASNSTSYETDYESLIPIQQLAHETQTAIILVTHTRKAADVDNAFNKIQGSMGIQAGCDTLIMLVKEDDRHILKIIGRRIIETEYAMQMFDGVWETTGDAEVVKEMSTQDTIREILEENIKPMSPSEIARATGIAENLTRVTLKRMKDKGKVKQDTQGKYAPEYP